MGIGLPGIYVPKNEAWQWLYLGIILFDLLLMMFPVLPEILTVEGIRKLWWLSAPSAIVFFFAWYGFPVAFSMLFMLHALLAHFSIGAAIVAGAFTVFAYLSFPLYITSKFQTASRN